MTKGPRSSCYWYIQFSAFFSQFMVAFKYFHEKKKLTKIQKVFLPVGSVLGWSAILMTLKSGRNKGKEEKLRGEENSGIWGRIWNIKLLEWIFLLSEWTGFDKSQFNNLLKCIFQMKFFYFSFWILVAQSNIKFTILLYLFIQFDGISYIYIFTWPLLLSSSGTLPSLEVSH